MSKKAPSLLAICPYYKDEDRQKVFCEGLVPNSSIHVAFSTPEMRKEFERNYCKSWDFETCPLAWMHSIRYEQREPE